MRVGLDVAPIRLPRLPTHPRDRIGDHRPHRLDLVTRKPLAATAQSSRSGWETAAQPGHSWRSPGGRADDRWPEMRADRRPATHHRHHPARLGRLRGRSFPAAANCPASPGHVHRARRTQHLRQRQIPDVQPGELTGPQTGERGEHHRQRIDRVTLHPADVVGHGGDLGCGQRMGGERLGVGVGRPGTGHRCARVRGDGAVHHRHVEDAAQRLERVLDRRTKTAQHINCSRDAPPNSRDRRITRVRYGAIGSFVSRRARRPAACDSPASGRCCSPPALPDTFPAPPRGAPPRGRPSPCERPAARSRRGSQR